MVPEPTGKVQEGHGGAEEGGGKKGWKRSSSVPPIPTSSPSRQQPERGFQRSHQRISFPTLCLLLAPLPPPIRPPSPSYTLPTSLHPLRRSTGDLSTNESAGFGLMSAAANQKRGLNVISGASTNRRARLERLTNRGEGDWGR